jgi:hypothetical protein
MCIVKYFMEDGDSGLFIMRPCVKCEMHIFEAKIIQVQFDMHVHSR